MIRAVLLLVAALVAGSGQPGSAVTVNSCCAKLRALDTLSGRVVDVEMKAGQIFPLGSLRIHLRECRQNPVNPAVESYASLIVTQEGQEEPAFEGWMISSSPTLSAMDHQRYDVWLIRCTTTEPGSTEM